MKPFKHGPSPAMAVAMLGVFLALGGVGVAATGGNFILGQPNAADKTTALSAPVAGTAALNVTNTNTTPGSTAASFNVAAGQPPYSVNSSAEVKGLNATFLDGLTAGSLEPTAHHAASSALTGLPNAQGKWTTILQASTGKVDPHGDSFVIQGAADLQFTPAAQSPTTAHLLLRVLVNGTQAGPTMESRITASDETYTAMPIAAFAPWASKVPPVFLIQAMTYGGSGTFAAEARSLVVTQLPINQ